MEGCGAFGEDNDSASGLHSVLTDGTDTRYNSAVKAGERDVWGWRETPAKRNERRGSGLE